MSKQSTLIFISALVLFSVQAFADPPGQMRMQTLISPPVLGSQISCSTLNLSDRAIEIGVTLAGDLSQFRPDTISEFDPGSTGSYTSTTSGGAEFCVVEWYGRPGEVLGSACAWMYFSDATQSLGYGCLDLREVDLGSDVD